MRDWIAWCLETAGCLWWPAATAEKWWLWAGAIGVLVVFGHALYRLVKRPRRPEIVAPYCLLHRQEQCAHGTDDPRKILGQYDGVIYYADGSALHPPSLGCS